MCWGGGASCRGRGFGSDSFIRQFLLHHYLGIYFCKRYRRYFSQTEVFTSNGQCGYLCSRGVGQAAQAGLSSPPPFPGPGFGSGSFIRQLLFYCTIMLEYVVVSLVQLSVWLPLSEGWGASCPGWFILPLALDVRQFRPSILIELYLGRDIDIISVKLRSSMFT